jgi:PAS domain S-box-containing protein
MALTLKVTHKLVLSFLCIALLVGGLGYLTYFLSGWVGDDAAAIDRAALEEVEAANAMARAAQGSRTSMLEAVAAARTAGADDAGVSDQAATARDALAGQIAIFERQLGASRARGFDADQLQRIQQAFGAYVEAAERVASLSASAPEDAAAVLEGEVDPLYLTDLAPLLDERIASAEAALAQSAAVVGTSARWSGWLGVAAAALIVLLIAAIGFFLTRFVAGSLRALTDAAHAISEGRLDDRVEIDSNDEIGLLGQAINEMIDQFATTTVSKSYVENIVQSMADPLVVLDPQVKISMVNQAALDLLGYDRSELLGKPVMTIFAHKGQGRGAAIKQTIEQALAGNVETSFKAKTDLEVPVSLSSALVREGNDVLGLVIVAKDITQQKKFETELIEAKDKAEQMVQLRDAFLANMSHEIRTPLTGILGSAQVLAEGLEGDHRNLAKIIEDAGTRLLDTINSVLEMARIEAGEVQPEVEVLNLYEEAEASARVLANVADKRCLLLRVEPPRESVYAQIDRSCLHRILNNLIGNAIKFTREGAITVEIEATQDNAILTVRDTGVGISKEFLPHLFDDFKQESTGLKRSHEGSGLGLAITKKLVEMMGGTISVDSIKGIGSAFSVTFPRVPFEQVPEAMAKDAPAKQQRKKPDAARYPWEADDPVVEEPTFAPPPAPEDRPHRDVLLIEDNAQNAYMAKFMLEDYETDIATTPQDAIEQVLHHQYRLLLIDINLGADRSGIDLLHEIRGIEGYEMASAVAVTAYALPGDEDRFLNEGFDDYVAKPFRKETLLEAVEQALATEVETNDGPGLDDLLGGSFDEDPHDDGTAGAHAEAHAAATDEAPSDPFEQAMDAGEVSGTFEDPDTQLFDDTLIDFDDDFAPVPAHGAPADRDPHAVSGDGAGGSHPAAGG